MKRIAIFGFVLLVITLFFAFRYFHSLSIGRARLINSANDLLVAHEQLQQNGALTNHVRVQVFTNRVAVGGVAFHCVLAADLSDLADAGSLVAATDGTLIWIDKRTGPIVFRGSDHKIVIPRRFRDF
jgi:hypothetical protein